MKTIDKAYAAALILLAAELAVMIISILSRPLSDMYLRVWGIVMLVTAAAALCCFIMKMKEKRKGN